MPARPPKGEGEGAEEQPAPAPKKRSRRKRGGNTIIAGGSGMIPPAGLESEPGPTAEPKHEPEPEPEPKPEPPTAGGSAPLPPSLATAPRPEGGSEGVQEGVTPPTREKSQPETPPARQRSHSSPPTSTARDGARARKGQVRGSLRRCGRPSCLLAW
eukprot:COSAG04_NODE_2930_length_3375_cov_2.137057_2_plen_157_part_00